MAVVQAETLGIRKTRGGMLATKKDLAKSEVEMAAMKTTLSSRIHTIGIALGPVQLIGLVAVVFAVVRFLGD